MNTKEALWTKDFILICTTNFLLFTTFYFMVAALPIFITDILKGDESQIGYIVGIFTLTALLMRPLAGHLVDTVGRKQILFLSLVFFAIILAGYTFVAGIGLLILIRLLHGITWSFATTSSGTLAADLVPASRRGEGMGFYLMSNTGAMAVGPALALAIIGRGDFNILFISAAAISALGLLCVLGINYATPVSVKKTDKTSFSFKNFYELRVISLAVVLFFVTFGYGGIISFITIYARDLNIDNPGVFFFANAISLLFARPWAGWVFDKHGPFKSMAIGFVAIIISFISLFLATGVVYYIFSAIFFGIGFGIIHPTIIAMAINKVEPSRRGAANATLFSAFDLGIGLGAILLGYLAIIVGLSTMYLISGIMTLIPLVLFYKKVVPEYYGKTDNE